MVTRENSQEESAAKARESNADEASTLPLPASERRPVLLALAVVLTVTSLFGALSRSGIWDPHELRVADLSRRIALTLLGAGDLALEGAVNTVPTLGDLARGQLPFTSVALGFKFFGLHEWAGRLPLAIWGLAGVLAAYLLVSRLADRASAALTAIVLVTTPLYFMHARTLLGDIVTMAAIAVATAGLALACFDEAPLGRRLLSLVAGLLGLAAGFGSRGALIGVAIPALGVGLAWLLARGGRERDLSRDAVGGLALIVGVGALAVGVPALIRADQDGSPFSMLVGAPTKRGSLMPTFDLVVHYLGHGLFPWSAVVPFAMGRMLAPPPAADNGELRRQASLRLTLLGVSVTAFGIYGVMAPTTGPLPFGGVFALAAMVALAMRDFERGAAGSRAMAMGVAAFAILIFYDFQNFPEKGLSAFVVDDARFPESFKETATKLLKYGTLAMVGAFFFSFMERQSEGSRRFDRSEYAAYLQELRTAWSGNLLFGLLVAEAALVGLAVLRFLGERRANMPSIVTMAGPVHEAMRYGFLALPALVLMAPLGAFFARDVARYVYSSDAARFVFSRAPLPRGAGSLLSIAAFGAVLSFVYYPTLAAQISPKGVYESYRKHAESGQPLGLLGASAGSASYYAGRNVPTFANVSNAFDWLMQGDVRKWLVIRADDLPQTNALFRARTTPPRNLPVLDARSSEIMLVSSALAAGQTNQNPFEPMISSTPPKPSRRVEGNFGNQLDALGWDVLSPAGKVVDSVVPGKPYRFVLYYKVIAPISGSWETFIHIDGFQRRYNGDHKTLDGRYPFHLWQVGDYITDSYTFTLEPNFTPGAYNVYYGLFSGSRRLEVRRGRAQEDRLEGGTLEVR